MISALSQIKELGENFNSRQLSEESDASARRSFVSQQRRPSGWGVKRLTESFSEGGGVGGGLLQNMLKREFIYNRACKKASQPFKAVYFCLPKVTQEGK